MRFKQKLVIFIFMLLIALPFSTTIYADEAIINADNLNVRKGPGTHFDKITQINSDEVYQIIQKQDDWLEIQLEEGTGWITTEYVTINDKQQEETKEFDLEPSKVTSITISNDNTQIRSGPTIGHEIIGFSDKGEVFQVTSTDDNWYGITYEGEKGYVYKRLIEKTQSTSTTNLKNKVIVIDAGHGGPDVGSIGVNGTYEKDLTYKTAITLKEELSILGAEVILTRENDEYIRLGSRPSLANNHNTDAFISIHYNSFPDLPSVTGVGSYYYHDQNKQLASYIQQEIINETGAKDRDIAYGDYLVLRQNYKTAVLLELDFISNSEMEKLLLTNAYQKKLVKGIINGLIRNFSHE